MAGDPAHDITHITRVVQNTLKLTEVEKGADTAGIDPAHRTGMAEIDAFAHAPGLGAHEVARGDAQDPQPRRVSAL